MPTTALGRTWEFHHGTAHHLEGGAVLPSAQTGKSVWGEGENVAWGQDAREHAHTTTNEQVAWDFAKMAGEKTGGREQVHIVEPLADDVKRGVEEDHDEWVSKTGFKVKETLDVMPGRQGTLPLNWSQFSRNPGMENNHPTDEQVRRSQVGNP